MHIIRTVKRRVSRPVRLAAVAAGLGSWLALVAVFTAGVPYLSATGLSATVQAQQAPLQVLSDANGKCPAGYNLVPGTYDSANKRPGACLRQQQINSCTQQQAAQGQCIANCPKGACIIQKYINPMINTLSIMVGVAVTISIVLGGIRYATSADNPQKVSEAKDRIFKSILVLIGYFTLYAFLNYVIPGGLT